MQTLWFHTRNQLYRGHRLLVNVEKRNYQIDSMGPLKFGVVSTLYIYIVYM